MARMFTPRQSAVWLRGATGRPFGDQYWVFCDNHYSVLFFTIC